MRKYTNAELCLIWIDSFIGLEYKHKNELFKLIEGKKDIKGLLESAKDYLISNVGQNEYNTLLASANAVYFDYVLESLVKRDITAITINSADYPKFLREIDLPPLVLYAKGNIELLQSENLFGIVGSRRSLPLSISLAKDYAIELMKAGFILVTGIAEGVDSAVLNAVLENDGKAISVIAGGFDNIYPKINQAILEKVMENGLVISEQPPEIVSKPYMFPIRNRIISALSKGVLVVSGAKKSGTLYTAEYALEYGKDLFAVPYSVGVASGVGCNDLIKRGALLTDSPQDILDFYKIEIKKEKIELSNEESEIVRVLKEGQLHVEKIAEKLSKQVFLITPTLSILEIKGVVYKSGNVYGLTCKNLEE